MTRIAVTLTTINIPTVLDDFVRLERRYGTDGAEVDYIVVGDRKTPSGTAEFIRGLDGRSKSQFTYLDIDDQKRRFGHHTRLWEHIPVDTFARRNFGDLLAYEEGYEIIIRIDDDNFPVGGDYFGRHAITAQTQHLPTVSSDNGWYNICEPLQERDGLTFYPRGFPFSLRWKPCTVETKTTEVTVALNAGLWLGDPDVDAITRLCHPVEAIAYDERLYGPAFALAPGTWAPINTQNTAFWRDTIPAAFISPFAGRYDDILSGYFLRRVVDHLGHVVCYGQPLLNQVRNAHNLWKDLDLERVGGETILQVTEILRNTKLFGSSYGECFGELVSAVAGEFDFREDFYGTILAGMMEWAELFARGV